MKRNIELELKKKYRKELEELEKEIKQESPDWMKERRREYLLQEILMCFFLLMPFYWWYRDATERNVDYLTKRIIQIFFRYEYWKKRLYKLSMEYKFTILRKFDKFDKNKITPVMIERAKEYPIEDIIQVNKNAFALCPFHEDRHPSLHCKHNFFHCFSCGVSGDVISLYMKQHNVDFVPAIKFLSR